MLLLLLFGLGALMPKSDMEELFKIPFLIEHYTQSHQDLSFFDFLVEHYQGTEHEDPNHQKLPLKQHQHQGLQIFDVLIPEVLISFSVEISQHSNIYRVFSPENYHSLAFAIPSPPPQSI